MSAFHKIVLAIAGSLNNGTFSPAPQGGNRALSKQTNALAERQAQTSAKTPPILNPIGKGIGKFWIPILLVTATALTTSIEQAQAADSPTPVMSPAGPANYDVITRHLLVPAPVQPAAVPVPVVVVAKPVLKRGAIEAGRWLIAVLAEWGVHTAIDQVFANTRGQEANVTVHGAKWVSNEYEEKGYSITGIPRTSWTTMADMGDEDNTSSALGWDGPNHRSMTQHEAKGYLERRIGKVSFSTWSGISPGPVGGWIFFTVQARSDHYQAELAKQIALARFQFPSATFTKASESIEKWKVGSFEMFSDFVDPAPILKKLGTENAIDSEANYYEAKATWEYRNLLPNGTWGEWEDAEKTFSQDTGDGIKSWEDHTFSFDFCDDNQEITDPEIYEGIKRFMSRRPVSEWKEQVSYIYRGGTRQWDTIVSTNWVRVGWEPCVVQKYQDLN